jgi:hypothetical protein
MSPTKRLYDLQDSKVYLGRKSVYGVRRLIWEGLLPYVQHKPNGKIWIDVRDLDKFIETNKQNGD